MLRSQIKDHKTLESEAKDPKTLPIQLGGHGILISRAKAEDTLERQENTTEHLKSCKSHKTLQNQS